MLGEIGSVSQPGHWRSISLFTPGDAQSDSRIFFNYLSTSQIAFLSRMTKGYCARMYLLIVQWQQEKQGRRRKPHSVQGEDYRFSAARAALLPLFVFDSACSCPALSALSAVLSVCLVSCLHVCLPVSYN